ncbi:MAG TPA: allantoinase AllB [Vicinamibacterales bacterium]
MLIVRGSRVVLPGAERRAALHIDNGTFQKITAFDDVPSGVEVFEAGDRVVSPGIVDTHVHVNEPGRTEWEGFDSATRAAAAGGVTTIVDMPLNSIPATTSAGALCEKQETSGRQCHVDVAFWGGLVPGNSEELDGLVAAGVRGFKCFLVPSGVEEFRAVDEGDLRKAMPTIARRKVPLLVHAESPAHLTHATHATQSTYPSYLSTRPAEAEVAAIELVIRLSKEFGTHVHIVHVACAEAVATIARAKSAGVPITAETCPHYLTFAADEIPDGATEYKCAPPIREAGQRDALWRGLADGALDLIATDHSPSPPALKCRGDFARAWGGIASLELSLPAVWTSGRLRGFQPIDLARWMSYAPASLAGLPHKGSIQAGFDADLVVWDPDAEFVVDAARLQQRHKLTPYAGRRLRGAVATTFLRGHRIWHHGALVSERGGQLL